MMECATFHRQGSEQHSLRYKPFELRVKLTAAGEAVGEWLLAFKHVMVQQPFPVVAKFDELIFEEINVSSLIAVASSMGVAVRQSTS